MDRRCAIRDCLSPRWQCEIPYPYCNRKISEYCKAHAAECEDGRDTSYEVARTTVGEHCVLRLCGPECWNKVVCKQTPHCKYNMPLSCAHCHLHKACAHGPSERGHVFCSEECRRVWSNANSCCICHSTPIGLHACHVCQARYCVSCFALYAVYRGRYLDDRNHTGVCFPGRCFAVKVARLVNSKKRTSYTRARSPVVWRWQELLRQHTPTRMSADVRNIILTYLALKCDS